MNELKKLIREIELLLRSNDLTDNEKSRRLAAEYLHYVCEFNDLAEKCQKLLERKMVLEADQLASSGERSLYNLQGVLNFPQKEEFEELYKMYDWPALPLMRNDVIKTLKNQAEGVSELVPLLEAYRKVARSTDLVVKIKLLRKIASLDKKNNEWEETLRELEAKRLTLLYDQAKHAILGEDYIQLQEIQNELLSNEWSVAVTPQVLNKIDSVLKEKREAELAIQGAAYIESINIAYSAQDLAGLAKAIKVWQMFVLRTNFQADAMQQEQIREAERYYSEQKTLCEEQEHFEGLLNELERGIKNEIPLPQLDYIYNQLKSANGDIPEELEYDYYEYHTATEAIWRRRKILVCAAAAAVSITVLTVIFMLVSTLILRHQEKKWSAHIEDVLNKQPSAEALGILENLKKNSPRVAQREKILALEKKALEKQQQEEIKRKKFAELAEIQLQLLKKFDRNQAAIEENRAKLRILIVDRKESNKFENLEKEFQNGVNRMKLQREENFQNMISQLKELQKQFYIALSKNEFDKAQTLVAQAEALSNQAGSMRDIPPNVLLRSKNILARTAEIKAKFKAEKEAFREAEASLNRMRIASTYSALKSDVDNFVAKYPNHPEFAGMEKLQKALLNSSKYFIRPENAIGRTVFHQDHWKKNTIFNSNKEAFENLKKTFERFDKIFTQMPLCALIISSDNKLYDFYYYRDRGIGVRSSIGNMRDWRISCLEGGNKYTLFTFKSENDKKMTVLTGEQTILTGKIVYPPKARQINDSKNLAPHVKFAKWCAQQLQQEDYFKIEQIILESWQKCMSDELIAPQMKLTFGMAIIESARKIIPKKEVYDKLVSELAKIQNSLKEGTKYNWLQTYQNKDKDYEVRTALNALYKKQPLSGNNESKFYYELLDLAMKRQITPIGYVKDVKGQLILANHSSVYAGELWQAVDKPPYFRVIGKFEGEKLLLEKGEKVVPFQIVFSPLDEKDTLQLTGEIEKKAENAGIKNIIWPETWPVVQRR